MNLWLAKVILLVGLVTMIAVRTPHIRRTTKIKAVKSSQDTLDKVLVALVSVGLLLPFVWIATPVLRFADYPPTMVSFVAGVVCLALGLWLLHRSHVDLGTNWSNTLEVRENHQLVVAGLYTHVRHPMYLALLSYGVGQALVLPNWIAGPAVLLPFACLVATRLAPEEKMMLEEFGEDYASYRARTKRLLPGVW